MDSYKKIFILVFSVALGITALALSFEGFKQSKDLRLRAKEDSKIYKEWEFNNPSTEGWVGTLLATRNGYLQFKIGTLNSPSIEHTSVNATLPEGLKIITISMSVKGAAPRCPPRVACDFDLPPFSATLLYTLANKSSYTRPLMFTGIPDGVMKSYALNLPNRDAITIKSIQLIFTGQSKPRDDVAIDWIRLKGPVPTPPPTKEPKPTQYPSPTPPSCPTAIGISAAGNCPPYNTVAVTFVCPDGYSGTLGDGKTCVLIDSLTKQVEEICKTHAGCPTPKPAR